MSAATRATRRRWLLPAALVGALTVLAVASLALGSAPLSPAEVVTGLLTGEGVPGVILRDIRLPRTLLALLVGATLGLSGAALQGLLRNPLADPALFGAPQAAALGAGRGIYSGRAGTLALARPAAAVVGALASVALVVTVAGRDPGITVLLLAGLAVSSLAGAGTSAALSLSSNPYALTEIVFWLLGSFEDRSFAHLFLAAPFALAGGAIILMQGEALRALTLGEDTARSLGVEVRRVRLALVGAVAVAVGGCVAVSGAIGFVGLVAPHLVRNAVGADPRAVLVPAALAGAALTLAADIVARIIPAGTELKVGAVTAMLGVPFFLWIVARRRDLFAGTAG